jgi:hypothetical protein
MEAAMLEANKTVVLRAWAAYDVATPMASQPA